MKFGPIYITPTEVARAVGWMKPGDSVLQQQSARQRALRWLKKSGVLLERGGRPVTTRELLKEQFPEVWEELELRAAERAAE